MIVRRPLRRGPAGRDGGPRALRGPRVVPRRRVVMGGVRPDPEAALRPARSPRDDGDAARPPRGIGRRVPRPGDRVARPPSRGSPRSAPLLASDGGRGIAGVEMSTDGGLAQVERVGRDRPRGWARGGDGRGAPGPRGERRSSAPQTGIGPGREPGPASAPSRRRPDRRLTLRRTRRAEAARARTEHEGGDGGLVVGGGSGGTTGGMAHGIGRTRR